MTDANLDQSILICILSVSRQYLTGLIILGRSTDNPLTYLIEVGKALDAMGADYIAMPCITAHYFHKELSGYINAPIINIICETVKYLRSRDVKRVGIMATEGTIESGLFQNELIKYDIEPIVPSTYGQSLVTDIIYIRM